MREASAAGTDIEGISVDAAEIVQIGASGASGVTITPATTITGAFLSSGGIMVADGQLLGFDEDAADPNDCDITFSAADGVLTIAGLNGANNENLTIDVDQSGTNVVFGSSATGIDFSALNMVTTGTLGTGAITGTTVGCGKVTSTAAVESSGLFDVTGATSLTLGSADVTAWILSGIDETLTITPSADLVTVTSGTGVATFDFGTINLATDALDLSSGSITNLAVGGLPDNTIDNGCMADNAIATAELADNAVTMAELDDDGNFVDWTGNWTFSTGTLTASAGVTLQNAETITNATDGTIALSGDAVDIPSDANPDTGAAGEIAIDSDDDFIEFYGSATRVVGAIQCESFTIVEPDTVQGITDDVKLKKFVAEAYPHGATIIAIHVDSATSHSDTYLFQEWDDATGSSQTTVESIALSATTSGEDDGVDDGAMAADSFLVVNLDDTPDDIAEVLFTITYVTNPGD